jgi:membrane associated rhomboid family serine protease
MSFGSSGRTTPVVLNLIIINALVYLVQYLFKPFTLIIALFPISTPFFKPYQLVTHMFAHDPSSFFHILFNMYALWMFGTMLERVWGPKKFLIFYLVCGLFAGLIQAFWMSEGWAIGASGAIMGLEAAFAYLFPNVQFYVLPLPFPIKAKFMIPIFAAIDLFLGYAQFSGDNTAHFAHLGGMIMGFILVLIWGKNKPRYY